MVWQKGPTLSYTDGAGHVAVVEQINDDGSIITSESGYGCASAFWT
jgi:surface antigen